jgi:hypothetical protein
LTVEVDNLTGSINSLDENVVLAPIDPGDAATNNNNANIPLSDEGNTVLDGSGKVTINNGDGVTFPPGTYYVTEISMSGSAQLRTSGPTTIYVTDKIAMSGGSFVNPTQIPGDLKLLVMGNSIAMSGSAALHAAVYAPNAKVNLSGSTEVYGMFVAEEVKSSSDGGFHADLALVDFATTITGGYLVPPTEPLPPPDWQGIADGELVIGTSAITGNRTAVNVSSSQSLEAQDSEFSDNAEWGLFATGPVDLQNCTLNNNTVGGIWLDGITAADVQATNLSLTNNGDYGLYAESCDLTFDATNIAAWAISGSSHAIAACGGQLTFDGVTVSGAATAGVLASNATLTVRNSCFQNNGYGVAAENSTVLIENATLCQNSVGLYSSQNMLTVRNSAIHTNTVWGASVFAGTGLVAQIEGSTIHTNDSGLRLVNGTDGSLLLRSGTVVRDNPNSGLYLENCQLTLDDQAGGTNWSVLRNGYGIHGSASVLTLADVTVTEGGLYGVRCEDSEMHLTNCTISGVGGVYADAANDVLSVQATRIDATGSGGWGVVRYGGNLDLKNCVVNGFDGGMFLYSANGIDQAEVTNCTLGNLANFGIHLAGGDMHVRNSIVAGLGAGDGLSQVSGLMTHSHNLVHGFSNPFSGTSPNSTELAGSPQFIDEAAGDFHLAVGSPAINAGVDMGVSITTDFEGNTRPSFHVFDIGAYEYTDPNGSLRVLKWTEER